MRFQTLVAPVAALLVAACSGDDPGNDQHGADGGVDCSTETRADEYVAGLEETGENGLLTRLMESEPAPPRKGDNTWTLELVDDTGATLSGATLDVDPQMPDHGHGTSITAEVSDNGDGTYTIDPVNLWMPGYWEIHVDIDTGDVTDRVTYNLCIEG